MHALATRTRTGIPASRLLLPLLVLLAPALSAQVINPANGHGYLSSADTMTIEHARAYAATVPGGYVLSVTDAAEEQWIFDSFSESHFWLGLSEEITEGVWLWDSGEPFAYQNFCLWNPALDPDHVALHSGPQCRSAPQG